MKLKEILKAGAFDVEEIPVEDREELESLFECAVVWESNFMPEKLNLIPVMTLDSAHEFIERLFERGYEGAWRIGFLEGEGIAAGESREDWYKYAAWRVNRGEWLSLPRNALMRASRELVSEGELTEAAYSMLKEICRSKANEDSEIEKRRMEVAEISM